jgi:hypothetical protein
MVVKGNSMVKMIQEQREKENDRWKRPVRQGEY